MIWFITIYIMLFLCTQVSICLKVTNVKVPKMKQRGESAVLECEYEMEGGRLYSVKWYRDNEEFYRYIPLLRPPQHAHTLDGVKVELEKSSDRKVYLTDLTLKSRGHYRCEVSEEAPSFHSDQAESFMEVYYFPRESPYISGHEIIYTDGEPVNVNCTSSMAFPAPDLQWRINGEKVSIKSWLTSYRTRPAQQGLLISTLGLRAPAKPNMRIRCISSIGSHRRERTVLISTNNSCCCRTDITTLVFLLILLHTWNKIS